MNYSRRLTLAAILSIMLHAILLVTGRFSTDQDIIAKTGQPDPIVLNLQPPAPSEKKQLVETHTATDLPVEQTDLISDRNAKAQDLSEVEGRRPAPHVDQPAEFDDPGAPPPSPQVTAMPPPPPLPRDKEEKPEAEPKPARTVAPPESISDAGTRKSEEEQQQDEQEEEPIMMAQALPPQPPQPPTESEHAKRPRGRIEGGIKRKGIMGFEAMEDEIAPYLLEIRRRVERQWRSALGIRYSGTSPTKAVVDCAISPAGEILHATIVESGSSALFSLICRESIEKAGPFGAFPFEVPDLYRSENLEIAWTFRFLE